MLTSKFWDKGLVSGLSGEGTIGVYPVLLKKLKKCNKNHRFNAHHVLEIGADFYLPIVTEMLNQRNKT
jgi:hypothetical protein